MTERIVADYIDRVEFSPVEEVLERTLGARFGDRFRTYRNNFFRSLNADQNNYLPDFPLTVTMELVNRCNLSCIMCYTANHKAPKAALDIEQIRELLREGERHQLPALLIGMGSEGLLYKPIRDVVLAAREAQVMDIFLMTNGVLLDESLAEFLVDQQVSRVSISLDAATPETFEKIRGKPELERIERNIRFLAECKRKRNSELPIVRLSFCVQDENRHEQDQFRDKWQGIVNHLDFQDMYLFDFIDKIDGQEVKATPAKPIPGENAVSFCSYPFGYLNIWANGDISPCCTFYGKKLVFGNIKSDTLGDVWKSQKMADLRREFLEGHVNMVCRVCMSQRENKIDDAALAFVPQGKCDGNAGG